MMFPASRGVPKGVTSHMERRHAAGRVDIPIEIVRSERLGWLERACRHRDWRDARAHIRRDRTGPRKGIGRPGAERRCWTSQRTTWNARTSDHDRPGTRERAILSRGHIESPRRPARAADVAFAKPRARIRPYAWVVQAIKGMESQAVRRGEAVEVRRFLAQRGERSRIRRSAGRLRESAPQHGDVGQRAAPAGLVRAYGRRRRADQIEEIAKGSLRAGG